VAILRPSGEHFDYELAHYPTVKAAVEALQYADKAAWNRLFTSEAELYDDGSPRGPKNFTQEVFGREYFVCIDKIANNGLYIEGVLHSSKRGDFRTYFNFELNDAGRIVRLDIGQVELPSCHGTLIHFRM
jgi:hypothetical protein